MGKARYVIGGAIAAAAGYLYFKHRDGEMFEYEAGFETEVEVVEPDGTDESPQHVGVNDNETTIEQGAFQEQSKEDTHTCDSLTLAVLDAVQKDGLDGVNVYAVEPFAADEEVEGRPDSKYDDLTVEPDVVVSSFGGNNLMFVVADGDRLADYEALLEDIRGVSEQDGFSVVLVIPDTSEAREDAETIEERLEDVSLQVKTADDVREVL